MPGVVMEKVNAEGPMRRSDVIEATNGAPGSFGNIDKSGQFSASMNGPVHVNGAGKGADDLTQHTKVASQTTGDMVPAPFELPHITQGFFPFGTLINRAVQQCWNDLSDLITELAAIQVSSEGSNAPMTNGKPTGNQSSENVHKKLRILDFAHTKRAEFIKLLVLSQWSRQAAEVSRLIDIQGFIRTRHQAYENAVQYVGEVKRDLVRAQVANPDLKTALEVLSKGTVASLPDFGYKPPKSLTARATLKSLRKINRIISIRLALHDQAPCPLRNYRVHDGRVTFTVPGEFELDLSVAEEAMTSQFFFVDIRFLFSPSSPIPKGRIFNELDAKVNDLLRTEGLMGCYNFLHGLVLTNKVNTLFRQARDLARGLWSEALRIELLHRTLVVQYWPLPAGPKSWVEIGVRRGPTRSYSQDLGDHASRLGLRWMRDGQQVNSDAVHFDTEKLSMERILRSVIALHASHLLATAYTTLKKYKLFSNSTLSLRAQLSSTEPGDCYLDIQLTFSRHLRASVEPLSGIITLSGTSSALERHEGERAPNKSAIEELLARVTRLRCLTAVDEIESGIKALGLESVNQRGLGLDVRRLFPSNVLRSAFFTHPHWDRRWVAAVTSSMDSDNWWLLRLHPVDATRSGTPFAVHDLNTGFPPAHAISRTLMAQQGRFDYAACAELTYGLTGMLAIYANARCLADLPNAYFYPPLEQLQLGSDLQVPDLYLQYKTSTIPSAFRIPLPSGLEKESYLQDTVRLSFHGIDRESQSVVLMAYGTLRFRIKCLIPLVSQMDSSLLLQDKGSGFALRLLVPAGHSVVLILFERLQRLECVLSILQSLIQKHMEPRSLSLNEVAFSYGPNKKFSCRFGIHVSGPSLSTQIDVPQALSNLDPLFQLRLQVNFDYPSPHRRISESLTVALNHRFAESGVNSILGFMSDTFPLLHCLDQITLKPAQTQSSLVHVTVRTPVSYQIHYPRLKFRFRLSARPRNGRSVWVLEDANATDLLDRSQIVAAVREKVYNSKGDGWQGIGDGAMSSIDEVGGLLSRLHECMCAVYPVRNKQDDEGKPEQPATSPPRPQGVPQPPKLATASPQKGGMGKADVITID
ncbi:Mediator complex subunit Med14 [Penicillium maclennaniae]|uniref:Mediator complex subunit Med14 n=1 Tax=Penicillium maclennaniae TaxID=1343394 RepID=UPI0025402DC5|nr:Mediator complex subunit Med14 [Penicillium maclennaniae]KAJ5670212.1 Mediator complex subunit Med14 [Penicillium maclennaniae]